MSTPARVATAISVGAALGIVLGPVILVIVWQIGDGGA